MVRHYLGKILASPAFRRCPKLQRFLEVTVGKALHGKNEAIKEYTIAIEAFGKAADFDPAIDNIVRVQAGNLRRRLDGYYKTTGEYDSIEITYETGDYRPRFLAIQQNSQPPAAIAIMPIVADNARNSSFGQGLSDELARILSRSPELRVVAHGSALAVREAVTDEQSVASALNVGLVVNGSVSGTGLSRRVRMNLFDATNLNRRSEAVAPEAAHQFPCRDGRATLQCSVRVCSRPRIRSRVPKQAKIAARLYPLACCQQQAQTMRDTTFLTRTLGPAPSRRADSPGL